MLPSLVGFKGSLPKGLCSGSGSRCLARFLHIAQRQSTTYPLASFSRSRVPVALRTGRTTVPGVVPQASGYLPSILPRLWTHEHTQAEVPSITAHELVRLSPTVV